MTRNILRAILASFCYSTRTDSRFYFSYFVCPPSLRFRLDNFGFPFCCILSLLSFPLALEFDHYVNATRTTVLLVLYIKRLPCTTSILKLLVHNSPRVWYTIVMVWYVSCVVFEDQNVYGVHPSRSEFQLVFSTGIGVRHHYAENSAETPS
jgi:hypothetical protein